MSSLIGLYLKMMTKYSRYALYYAPRPETALGIFGSQWLGWSLETGEPVKHLDVDGLKIPIKAITKTPRKYGFHGTLKPPFRLAADKTISALKSKVSDLAATLPAFKMNGLKVRNLKHFLALTPQGDAETLNHIAATLVKDLDIFRAPLNEAELAKRRRSPLSEKQESYLAQYGYPHIFDPFQFHLTLSGHLEEDEISQIQSCLEN